MLRSQDPEARRIAVDGVGKKVGALAVIDLQKLAGHDPDPRVRRAAIRWLGQVKDKEAVDLLARQMRHLDENVRAAAALALAKIGRGDLAAFAKVALADNTGVRLPASSCSKSRSSPTSSSSSPTTRIRWWRQKRRSARSVPISSPRRSTARSVPKAGRSAPASRTWRCAPRARAPRSRTRASSSPIPSRAFASRPHAFSHGGDRNAAIAVFAAAPPATLALRPRPIRRPGTIRIKALDSAVAMRRRRPIIAPRPRTRIAPPAA
jgi:hypothetical protein